MTDRYLDELDGFVKRLIEDLNTMDPNEAKKVATDTLIRIGVLREDGSRKEQIVTGDFFGW
ncbi:MAG: hypothetical protein IJ608_13715 [Lachnospiraceae bacterium]|nr:hypothetical protein [Lachnospiraceae bacterium]